MVSFSQRELSDGGEGFHCGEGDDTGSYSCSNLGAGKVVQFHSDNMAVVCALNRVYSASDPVMHLVRCLAARHAFWFVASDTPGIANVLVDHLSCNHMRHIFLILSPGHPPE